MHDQADLSESASTIQVQPCCNLVVLTSHAHHGKPEAIGAQCESHLRGQTLTRLPFGPCLQASGEQGCATHKALLSLLQYHTPHRS